MARRTKVTEENRTRLTWPEELTSQKEIELDSHGQKN